MKYLRKFYESLDDGNITDYFLHSIDMCYGFNIEEIYFDNREGKELEYAHNDFSNSESIYHPNECVDGFELTFIYSNDSKHDLSCLIKYSKLLNQLDEDIERFRSIEKTSSIFLEDVSVDLIVLIIRL